METKGLGKLFEQAYPGRLCPGDPIIKMDLCGEFVGAFPEFSEIVFHIVGSCQRLVQAQRLFESLSFIAFRVEVLEILQQEPSGPFEYLLVEEIGGLMVEIPSQSGELFVEELDHVEMIENDRRTWQMSPHRSQVSPGHVHCHPPRPLPWMPGGV